MHYHIWHDNAYCMREDFSKLSRDSERLQLPPFRCLSRTDSQRACIVTLLVGIRFSASSCSSALCRGDINGCQGSEHQWLIGNRTSTAAREHDIIYEDGMRHDIIIIRYPNAADIDHPLQDIPMQPSLHVVALVAPGQPAVVAPAKTAECG